MRVLTLTSLAILVGVVSAFMRQFDKFFEEPWYNEFTCQNCVEMKDLCLNHMGDSMNIRDEGLAVDASNITGRLRVNCECYYYLYLCEKDVCGGQGLPGGITSYEECMISCGAYERDYCRPPEYVDGAASVGVSIATAAAVVGAVVLAARGHG